MAEDPAQGEAQGVHHGCRCGAGDAARRVTATGESTILNIDLMKTYPGKLRVLNPPYFTAITAIGLPYGDFDWWLWLDRWVDN